MFSYLAFGLGIRSDFPLPEFIAAEAQSDVVISLDPNEAPADRLEEESSVEFGADETTLGFKRAGVFRVRHGREILVSPAPGADMALIRLYLLGRAMATLLYQRGLLVLHASAVEVEGRAVAFMGTSLLGKSSVAASLYRCGHAVVADDVTAVDLSGRRPVAIPAFPQLKLDPEVARVLGYDVDSLLQLHPMEARRGLRADEGFSTAPHPLALIYLLGPDSGQPRSLRPQEVLIELVRHSYPARLLQSGGAAHLAQCAALARSVPALRLSPGESRIRPSDLTDRVRQDLAEIPEN